MLGVLSVQRKGTCVRGRTPHAASLARAGELDPVTNARRPVGRTRQPGSGSQAAGGKQWESGTGPRVALAARVRVL